jgi:thiamine biosynthesis lipoprotein
MEQLGYDRSFDTMDRIGAAPVTLPSPRLNSWRRVQLDRRTRSVSLPADLALDLGGIAKGWTVDRVALDLAPLGPVLVDAGGDLRVVGTVPGEGWPVGVQDAFAPECDRAVVRLRGGALATSSVGGRHWRRGEQSLHHVIDPRTGTSAVSGLHAVTAHAPTAAAADVAAKVALVLGPEAGAAHLRARGLSATFTSADGVHSVVGDFPLAEPKRHESFRFV